MAVDLSSIDSLQAALTYHRERHTVLAGNIANLDTPGYRPKDLTRTLPGEAAAGELAATDPGHLTGGTQSAQKRQREMWIA